MIESYFTQVGLILFPICAYQLWASGKSFNQLPFRVIGLGLYGGIAAILCELFPVTILGQVENFQCVPIILSNLYGKRRSGAVSMAILVAFKVMEHQPQLGWNIAAILIYSGIPFGISVRYEHIPNPRRLLVGVALTIVTLVVELAFVMSYVVSVEGTSGWGFLAHLEPFFAVACGIQMVVMGIGMKLIENTLDVGRIRDRFSSLIDHSPIGISWFTNDLRFLGANTAYERITGYSAAEVVGQKAFALWFESDRPMAEALADSILSGTVEIEREYRLRHKSGREIFVRGTAVPMMAGDRLVGCFSMITDITEWKKSSEAMQRSDKLSAVGRLAAGVAHEIRNPLTALQGFLSLLVGAEDQERYVEIMKDELARIGVIANELLVLARPHPVQFIKRDIKAKLDGVLHLMRAEALMKSVDIRTLYDETTCEVECDPDQLKQVFINLLKNALDATETGGTVSVNLTRASDEAIVVRIIDTGAGISQDMLQRLGEPFFTTKSTGTGLGLMVCKKIIESHHGVLEFASEVGQGTTVTLVLPVRQPQLVDEVETA